MEYTKNLDCTGVYCPIPIIQAKREIESMEQGEVIRIEADDPGSKADFPAWCEETGNTLLDSEDKDGTFVFYIKKGGSEN